MRFNIFCAGLALAATASASPLIRSTNAKNTIPDYLSQYTAGFNNPRVDSSAGGQAICISGIVDVKASATNIRFNFPEITNRTIITELFAEALQINSTVNERYVAGNATVSGTFGIYSQLCFPNGHINTSAIQFLTHGLGADRSYWNIAPGYSHVDYAASRGYTTFIYDRLGTGLSDHPDGIQVVQRHLQLSIAHSLIQSLRNGAIANTKFSTVIGIGHSFGSFQTHYLATSYPSDLDAVILTGISLVTSGMPLGFASGDLLPASQAVPARFANISNSYTTSASPAGLQFAFFRFPNYDPAIFNIAEATKGTVTLGEFFSGTSFPVAENFTGPVDVVNGNNDLQACDGDCLVPYDQSAKLIEKLYPKAANGSASFNVLGAGHFLPHHYGGQSALVQIHDFLAKNGL